MKTEISRHATFAEANAALIEARGMETAAREDYLVTNGNLNDYEEKNYNIEMVNDEFIVCEFTEGEIIKQYMSEIGKRGGKKGGSATTARKKSASAANLNAARAQGKVGGYPKGRPRKETEFEISYKNTYRSNNEKQMNGITEGWVKIDRAVKLATFKTQARRSGWKTAGTSIESDGEDYLYIRLK